MPNFVEKDAVTYLSLCQLCDFMIGLIGKPKLCTKFEIASFSHCINIKEEPQIRNHEYALVFLNRNFTLAQLTKTYFRLVV